MKNLIFKRIIGIGLVLGMLVSAAGCAFTGQGRGMPEADNSSDENYITCMVWDRGDLPEGSEFDDNKLANWIREQVKEDCGVEVHYVGVNRSNSDDELSLMIADGTAPDIIFTYTTSLFGYLSRQGKIADLTDAYTQYGININQNIGSVQYMGQANDRQVAIMKRRGFQIPRHTSYIRKDWCDALNMEVPKTKEELIDYLYAVKEKNPGNVEGLVPWAFGGDVYSEKFYQNFVASYVGELSERDAFIYSEKYLVLKEEAKEGLRTLNKLYNDEIISMDFAADTDNKGFEKTIKEGRSAFFVDDSTLPFSYFSEINSNGGQADYEPLLCFDLPEGGYRNVTEPLYGMYIMVPSVSKSKVDAAMKYLNWLSDPENAIKVCYTPEYGTTSKGAPIELVPEKYNELGYPGTPIDYCIVNEHFDFVEDKDAQVSTWAENCSWEKVEWFEKFYDICTTDQYVFPTTSDILNAESGAQSDQEKMIVEFAYNLICCPANRFDSLYDDEYKKLMKNGIGVVLDERADYYDSGKMNNNEDGFLGGD